MDMLIYWVARAGVACLQALPLIAVARLGRALGALAFRLDGRHRRVALDNLARCFGTEKSPAEIRALAQENFRRIGENYCSAIKTAAMSPAEMAPHFTFSFAKSILPHEADAGPQSRIVAVGHFGNFELYARFGQFVPIFKCAATYRALKQPALNRLMVSLRQTTACRFFERRTEAAALKAAMSDTGLLLGLLADQHAGRNGLRLPFLGHDCSTSAAPAVFALRYHCPLHTSICYRTGLAQWRIEVGDEIPTRVNGVARSVEEIMGDVNRAFEAAVLRDPANWFWVHKRWKPEKSVGAEIATESGEPQTGARPPASPVSPRRILVRGPNWLGDAVMTTPALLRLREKFPAARIVLLTPEKLRGLWRHHPAVNETISFAPQEGLWAIGKKLRAGRFDLALVLPNSPRSALEVWLAGIPRRIGARRPWRNFFLTQSIAPRAGAVKMRKRTEAEIAGLISRAPQPRPGLPAAAHQIHEYLHLVAALGAIPEPLAPRLAVDSGEMESVLKKFGLEPSGRPVLGLNPGAEYGPAKRWPLERFIAVAREIQRQIPCTWLLFGGANDAVFTREIESALRFPAGTVFNLAGKTSLPELMALLKSCRVLLTNDTGPMHVAAALGTPVVVPFGSTSPGLTGPGLPGDPRHHLLASDAPCAPCFLRQCPVDFRCMDGLRVEPVVKAVLESLSREPAVQE